MSPILRGVAIVMPERIDWEDFKVQYTLPVSGSNEFTDSGFPNDQLPDAASLENHGRTISRLLSAQRSPDFVAGVFVQSDHR